jgi:drug/metabolite transporter (DMT)-like permease
MMSSEYDMSSKYDMINVNAFHKSPYQSQRLRAVRSPKRRTTLRLSEVSKEHPTNNPSLQAHHSQIAWYGTLCALVSAVGYTAANVCLRAAINCDPIWVSCVKSVPTVVFVGLWLIGKAVRGNRDFPRLSVLCALILAGLFGQIFGNVAFQWSLGIVGIALAVPLVLGMMIVSGAILGRLVLHEPVTKRMATAMFTLIIAICILSSGAREASRSLDRDSEQSITDSQSSANWSLLALGIVAASGSGFAYAVLGIVIRYGVTGRASVAATLFTVGIVGTISLGIWSALNIGITGMLATTTTDWIVMLQAGIYNAIAFLALTKALQLTTVVYVNALNASQAAMAAAAGVLFFQEAPTIAMCIGVALTAVGLLMMRTKPATPKPKEV